MTPSAPDATIEDRLDHLVDAMQDLTETLGKILLTRAEIENQTNKRWRWMLVVLILIVGAIGVNNGRISSDTHTAADNAAAASQASEDILDQVATLVNFVDDYQNTNTPEAQRTLLDNLIVQIDNNARSLECDKQDNETLDQSSIWTDQGCVALGD